MINNHFHIKHRPRAIKESAAFTPFGSKKSKFDFFNVLVPELVLLLSFLGEREVQINF